MSKIISVKIKKISTHPNASKLKVCEIDTGAEIKKVVCGAQNVKEGMITILAQVGSKLPNGKMIESAELRGVTSQGMLCSPLDLSIREESGIIDLPPATNIGLSIENFSQQDLSSTPWFTYKLVDTQVEEDGMISTLRGESPQVKESMKVLAQTFWDGSNYLYRKL